MRWQWSVYLATAAVAQAAFWWFSMPGPQLRQAQQLPTAMLCCLVAALTLMVGPCLVATRYLRRTPQQLGLGRGDAGFGWKAVAVCGPLMLLGTLLGSTDPQIQAYYPIPGPTIGRSPLALLSWWGAYAMFYIAFEFFYRGFLLRGLSDLPTRSTMVRFLVFQTVCCFAIHIGKPVAELFASLPASLAFGWIAWRSRSIWYGVLIHFAVGLVNDMAALWQSGQWFP